MDWGNISRMISPRTSPLAGAAAKLPAGTVSTQEIIPAGDKRGILGETEAPSGLPGGIGYKDPGGKSQTMIPTPDAFGFKPLATEKDPLSAFINRGIAETPDALRDRYGKMFDAGSFGFRPAGGLGMDPAASGALKSKLSGKLSGMIGSRRQNLLNQVPFDFGERQQTYQGLADSNMRRILGIEGQAAAAREAAKQKRQGLTSGLFGLGGAAVGGYFGGGAGAAVGGGAGSMLGSQI